MIYVLISKEAAIDAVREAAWTTQVTTCGHTGCEDHLGDGPAYVHCMSGFGMDMPLEGVEDVIRSALKVGWDPDALMRHHLVVLTADKRTRWYDVPLPAEVAHAHA